MIVLCCNVQRVVAVLTVPRVHHSRVGLEDLLDCVSVFVPTDL